MARITLTRTSVRDLPPPPPGKAKVRYFDDRLRGFIAERRTTGVTFYMRYYDERHRGREVSLGRYGEVTVDQARQRAEQLRAQVSLGGDPVAERDRRRAVPTLADFAHDRFLPHARERLRSAANYEAQLRRRILPHLGCKALNEVTAEDVAQLRRRHLAAGLANGTVNRDLALLRSMFNLALRWQLYEGRNPAASPGMLPEQHRDKYLTPAQTQALVRALQAETWLDGAAALALLLLTGARKGEVTAARWEYVDLERGTLAVPRSKNGRPRYIPLSSLAVQVLQRQAARRVPGNPHVFPSRRAGGRPIVGLQKAWERARAAAGLPADLRIHDLRHSLASALANAGTPLYEIGAVLGHRQLSTTTRYAHHSPERLVETATAAARALELLPAPVVAGKVTK